MPVTALPAGCGRFPIPSVCCFPVCRRWLRWERGSPIALGERKPLQMWPKLPDKPPCLRRASRFAGSPVLVSRCEPIHVDNARFVDSGMAAGGLFAQNGGRLDASRRAVKVDFGSLAPRVRYAVGSFLPVGLPSSPSRLRGRISHLPRLLQDRFGSVFRLFLPGGPGRAGLEDNLAHLRTAGANLTPACARGPGWKSPGSSRGDPRAEGEPETRLQLGLA